jgi:hypothetical protein
VQCNLGAPVVYIKRQKLALPGAAKGAPKDATTAEAINVDMNPRVLLVDVLRGFRYMPEGGTKAIPTNILIYADSLGQLERRTEWDDKNAARQAKADHEGGTVTSPPPPTPKPPTPPPTPPKPRPERTPLKPK